MIVGVVKETFPGERRVALVPAVIPLLEKPGLELTIESGAGRDAGYRDEAYAGKGARVVDTRADVFALADVICQVRTPPANLAHGAADLEMFRRDPEQFLIGLAEPLSDEAAVRALASAGVTSFALELLPRITRAQTMDVLSSQATVSGYKAVLMAASALPMMMPMMMTAAGTIKAAHVLVVGAGVAGLQAIATAKRLGAVVSGYDIRTAVKEEVESLGAKFVQLELESAEGEGGYAREMDEEFYRKQRELMTRVVAEADVVITTAAVPGRKAPVLITDDMVKGMKPGSVIIDLAAERGGNVDLTRPDETVVDHDVSIFGPTNLAATAPYHASQMFARNVTAVLGHLVADGAMQLDLEDEITSAMMLTRDGEIVQPSVREHFGLQQLAASESSTGSES